MPRSRMPLPVLLILTGGPALMIGATLWLLGSLVPACMIKESERLTAPDGEFDLVTFSRDCGEGAANIQAALVPPGEEIPYDAASFFSLGTSADLAPRWDEAGNIVLTVPSATQIYRQDQTVAGRMVLYR